MYSIGSKIKYKGQMWTIVDIDDSEELDFWFIFLENETGESITVFEHELFQNDE